MASRRKSAKPTNKLRHQLQVEEEDEEDLEEPTLQANSIFKATLPQEAQLTTGVMDIRVQGSRATYSTALALEMTTKPAALYTTLSETSEPHIALPSDIYHDFQALKSATRLDTTELMRKLIKDYQQMAVPNQATRERRLNDVIGDLFVTRLGNVLDLSKRKGITISGKEQEVCSSPVLCHRYTDDQLAMGILDDIDDNGPDLKPLDLTLSKHEEPSTTSSFSAIEVPLRRQQSPVHLSSFQSFTTSKTEAECLQSFKHAGSYVINLEPSNESMPFANSSLAQVLQMDIPLKSFRKEQTLSTESSENAFPKERKDVQCSLRNSSSSLKAQIRHNNVALRSKLFHEDKQPYTTSTVSVGEETQSVSCLGGLPSYAEAITSVLNSQQSKRGGCSQAEEPTISALSASKTSQESQPSPLSFVRINTEDANIKFLPLNSQFITNLGSLQEHPKQQQNLLQHLLQNQLKSENKPLPQSLQNVSSSSLQQQTDLLYTSSSPVSQIQMIHVPGLKSDVTENKLSEASYPNFLLDPHPVGIQSIPASLPGMSMSSSTLPNTSVPLSTFFMTTSPDGGVGHMVAIPVIHALPEGVTGLQPFAFAPHPVPQSVVSQNLTDTNFTISTSRSVTSAEIASSLQLPEEQPNHDTPVPTLFTTNIKSSSPMETIKPKPGRPRGRGGRGQSQKTQNKDMKLLTENTLFPGVYTSILKLPWSRRSRNKTKIKTVSEIKKEAQIIAQSRIYENDSNLTEEGYKLEQQDSNKESAIGELRPQNSLEKISSTRELNQERDQDQRLQVQQQKLKDLEQQQRLQLQYHLRLQEEQQKLTKQIEQSYLSLKPNSSAPTPFSVPTQQMVPGEQETLLKDTKEKECSNLLFSANMGIGIGSESLPFLQPLLSKDQITMMYSNNESSPSKKSQRKRGRPPKMTNIPLKTDENILTLNSSFKTDVTNNFETENFLHKNVTMSNFTTVMTNTIPQTNSSVFPQNVYVPVVSDTISVPFIKTETTDADDNNEITVENKIACLSNQTGLELKATMSDFSSADVQTNNAQIVKCEEGEELIEDTMYQEMKLAMNKSLVDVKPRRKKVSRLLKSDENFMYATFKIKPKGLTPRKSRRRRKDVLASTAAVAETIASLRQKALHDSAPPPGHCVDISKTPSMVAWKFHEQYPCPNDEDDSKCGRAICIKCGNGLNENEELSRLCEICLRENAGFSLGVNCKEFALNSVSRISVEDSEIKAECCVTCGKIFQKHFSESSVRCETCRNNVQSVIKSSKLFSFQDETNDSSLLGSNALKSSTGISFFSLSDTSVKEGVPKFNNNHLFCSLCRMEFTKICDYLTHIRETHETKIEAHSQVLPTPNDLNRRTRVSKTKKSLAHKTLTCPVEECPHFFREQKDLDLHFTKKHPDLGISLQGNSNTATEDNDLEFDSSLSTQSGTCSGNTKNISTDSIFSVAGKTAPATVSSEKPLQCEFCEYRCRQKNALTWHMRKHPEAASQYRRYSNLNVD